MTNEPKDNPDKVEYEKAREEKICELKCLYAFPDDIFTSCCGLPTALDILRKFDIAEGERRGIEKSKDAISKCFMEGFAKGKQEERERIEGIIANKLDCYECYDVANKAQLVWAIKKAIAEE